MRQGKLRNVQTSTLTTGFFQRPVLLCDMLGCVFRREHHPKPLFRHCETCGSGSDGVQASQPRIPYERRATRLGAFSR